MPTKPTVAPNPSLRRINYLAKQLNANSYLEIGVNEGRTFFSVKVQRKVGVDPSFRFDRRATQSDTINLHDTTFDAFFLPTPSNEYYDIIAIDGLHTFEQTFRDL